MTRSAPFRTAFVAAALAAFATSAAQAERCVGGGFRFTEGNTFVTGATRKDEPCTIGYGLFSAIKGYSVVQRPRHGALGSGGYSGIRFLTAYKPDAGYVGPDEFAVKIHYLTRMTQVELTTVVHVQMTIGP
jgi:hypothetical protein